MLGHFRRSPVVPVRVVALLTVLAACLGHPALAAETDPLPGLRRTHAKRLSELAGQCNRWTASVPARAALLDPEARTAAGSFMQSVKCLAIEETAPAGDAASAFQGPLVFPPPDSDGAPPRASDRDAAEAGGAGLTATLHFADPALAAGATLRLERVGGPVVETVPVPPERLGTLRVAGVAAFVPREALAAKAAYKATASWGPVAARIERTWTFKTGG